MKTQNIMTYYRCDQCFQIESETDWLLDQNGKKCKHCGMVSDYKLWPSAEIRELIETIKKYDQSSSEYGLVTSVFTCTALELLLEHLLFTMAMLDRSFEETEFLVDLLLDTNQGRAKRLQLYKRLGSGSFKSEAQQIGFPHFLEQWDKLANIRNKSVHGDLQEGSKVNPQLIQNVLTDALAVFSKLHNEYNQYSIKYQVAMEPLVEFEKSITKDLEKLKRWREQVVGIKNDEDEV
jgi:hypothetical protein